MPAVITTNDFSIASSTTLADIPGLTLPVKAREILIFHGYLSLGATLSTTGYKLTMTAPSGGLLVFDFLALDGDAGAVEATQRFNQILTAQPCDFGVPTAADKTTIHIRGSLINKGLDGNLTIQAAQSSSSATALLIKRGSYLIAESILSLAQG